MSKTLTIVLMSGYQENEDALLAVGLARAALEAGHGVNMFLFGNAVNLANKEKPIEGRVRISERLKGHQDIGKIGPEIEELASMGAQIATCHTNEYGRGTEGEDYRDGVQWGDVGETFIRFLLTTNVLLSIGH